MFLVSCLEIVNEGLSQGPKFRFGLQEFLISLICRRVSVSCFEALIFFEISHFFCKKIKLV